MELILVRRWWLVPVAAALGILIGLLVSLLGSTSRRAEAAVLISSPRGTAAVTTFLPNLRELATSSVLAGNVRSTLRLEQSTEDVRRRLEASIRPQSQVIVMAASDEDADRARQLAQEAAVVFTQLVDARFSDRTPPLQAAVLDSAHVLSAQNRHFLRNMLIGAAVGLLLGAAAVSVLRGGAKEEGDPWVTSVATRDLRRRESALDKRVETVSARERELAKRAGQLAARERELAARPAPATPPPEPAPAPEPEPEPAPAATSVPAVRSGVGGWNVNDLQRAVDSRREAAPEEIEQWRTYLFFLREHAASDGSLPSQFDSLVEDVFADALR
jgi:capsular polysaccharide biosynthesis protein